jgi:nucleoside phosphorylase
MRLRSSHDSWWLAGTTGFQDASVQKTPLDRVSYRTDHLLNSLLLSGCSRASARVTNGVLASGDQFVSECTTAQSIRAKTCADAIDMESAAVAQVSELHRVSFAAVRVVSDRCVDDAEQQYLTALTSPMDTYRDVFRAVVETLLASTK